MDDTVDAAELPLDGVGVRLARAREAAGLSRARVAAITKIPERHLLAIEQGNFAALPARTYAIGFSRSYARAVGENEIEIAALVRAEIGAGQGDRNLRGVPAFEPGDPARVPSSRLAWLSALAAVAVIVAGVVFWRGYYAPGGELPSILPGPTPSATLASTPPVAAPAGPVVLTALIPKVWVKITDGNGIQLFQKELAQGESYTVPADRPQVLLRTARPDALGITIGGQPVAKIADKQQTVADVPVTAAALLSRSTATAAPPAPATSAPSATPRIRPTPRPTAAVRPTPAASRVPSSAPPSTAPAAPATPTASGAAN